MKIVSLVVHTYKVALANDQMRKGALIRIINEAGHESWGEIAPLPRWNKESLEETLFELRQKQHCIMEIDWDNGSIFKELSYLNLLPGLSFGLESALLSLLSPASEFSLPMSALFMGSSRDILQQAELRYNEGFSSAKLKVNNFSFDEAANLIHQLKNKFRLRIDVNRAWKTFDALHFFSQFPLDTFDYVEEPFQNPLDLNKFPHPLAVDESFPHNLSLEQLESLPTLKALIYKPTIQGGMLHCLPLHEWAIKKGISLVLSSSFETDLGLAHVASIAQRLSLFQPIGIGTYHYLKEHTCSSPLKISKGYITIPSNIQPKLNLLVD